MKRLPHLLGGAALVSAAYLLPLFVLAACDANSTSVCNPLRYDSIMEFVKNALRLFVMLALPVLAFFIVLAGFQFILARGNATKLTNAKWNFLYVIVGTCLVLGAWLLASLIGATITEITG